MRGLLAKVIACSVMGTMSLEYLLTGEAIDAAKYDEMYE